MTNTSVLPSLMLGVVTIALSILLAYWKGGIIWNFTVLASIFCTAVLIILISVLGGRYFFTEQTPEVYADYSIQGKMPSDSFVYIAYCIWKECLFVQKHGKVFRRFDELYGKNGDTNKSPFTEKNIEEFQKLNKEFNERYHNIQKIDFMIVKLAESMSIPPQRLSDFLFQFSPEIYHREFRNTLAKMGEVIDRRKDRSKFSFKRNKLHAAYVKAFEETLIKRQEYQRSIIEYRDLHNAIIGMSTNYGMTNAFSAYCFGIQSCFKIEQKISSKKIADRILFIYHKRRTYPGFDLNAILFNFVTKIDLDKKYKECITLILNTLSSGENELPVDEFAEVQEFFEGILTSFEEYHNEQKDIITEEFKRYVEKEIEKNPETTKLVFVTQGFSSIVNSTIRKFTDITKDGKVSNLDKRLNKLIANREVYLYVLYSPEEMDTAHKTVTRYMRYKFKENPNLPEETQYRVSVKIGDTEWLIKRFNKKDSLNFLLSGAEFVQFEHREEVLQDDKGKTEKVVKKYNRIINNEGVHDFDLSKFSNRPSHIILAEDYKLFPRVLDETTFKRAFNRDYLEYSHLYEWDDERKIITGKQE